MHWIKKLGMSSKVTYFVLGIIVALLLLGGLTACYQGRKVSRLIGKPTNITLPDDLESYDQIVSISFHKSDNGETVKDVTYISSIDGKLHSHEYNDWGIFQGEIIWELAGE